MNRLLDTIARLGKVILIWSIILLGLPYLGGCAYVNFIQPLQQQRTQPPTVEKAQYEIVQTKSGMLIAYSKEAVVKGDIITIKDWYTPKGTGFEYHDGTLPLDKKLWGEITVRRRSDG